MLLYLKLQIANWKVQIENFIFPIFIFQLFYLVPQEYFQQNDIFSHTEARAG